MYNTLPHSILPVLTVNVQLTATWKTRLNLRVYNSIKCSLQSQVSDRWEPGIFHPFFSLGAITQTPHQEDFNHRVIMLQTIVVLAAFVGLVLAEGTNGNKPSSVVALW
jgi:hypothetical protein